MNRLTTTKKLEPELFKNAKDIDENKYFLKGDGKSFEDTIEAVADKLGKLEDIEDLCKKIARLPIYKKCSNNIIHEVDYIGFSTAYNFLTNYIEVYDQYGFEGLEASLPVDKYGIDWALTKEELL